METLNSCLPKQNKEEQNNNHFKALTTLTTILFIISFFVVFLIYFINDNTHNLIHPHFTKDPNFININHTSQIPISGNLHNDTKDSNFINVDDFNGNITSKKDPNFINHFHAEFKDSNFINVSVVNDDKGDIKISGNAGNDTGFVPKLQPELKDSNFINVSVVNDDKGDIKISGNAGNDTGFVPKLQPEFKDSNFSNVHDDDDNVNVNVNVGENSKGVIENKCNLYMGKWVRDEGYPLYKPGSCVYVDEAFDCQSNGRPDFEYLKWRWKPDDCHLPRFNATDFLVRLRDKRLMLVGDSMNRNQFESMLCILREGLPDKSKMYEVHGYKITKGRGSYVFKFVDFNCTIEFIRSHFLVREGTRINGQGNSNPTLSIDKIDKTAKKWQGADILVFNTGHWWTHGKTSRGKNYYKEGDYVYPRFDSVEAYRRALKTWAGWVDKNLNPARQTVFYRAYSSAHYRGGDWDSGGTCNGEKDPILSGAFLDSYPLKMKIVEEVIQQMKVPVILLNVTRLTNYRKDGHPSIYGKVRPEGARVSTRKQDCSHWCLPGVPDAWNELIYTTLVFQQNQ